MKIRSLRYLRGSYLAADPGDVVEVPDVVASALIGAGAAESAEEVEAAAVEEKVERAVVGRKPRRRRAAK